MKTLDRRAAEIFPQNVSFTNNQNRQLGRYLYARPYRTNRPYRQVRLFFAGSLRTAERRCHARPEMLFCPTQRHSAIHSLLLSQRLLRYRGKQRQMVGRWNSVEPRLQASHTTFANQWLRNIATQQGIQ